jgi:DNA-binding winged helix-turn-helix (wHTH) protein
VSPQRADPSRFWHGFAVRPVGDRPAAGAGLHTGGEEMSSAPGRFTRAAIHCEAGEAELRLSELGNWQLAIRGRDEREWRLACSGDLNGGGISPLPASRVEPVRIGKLIVDPEARRAFVEGEEVKLAAREFQLLAMLASEPTRVFSVEELQRHAFGYEVACPQSEVVRAHASRLRVKLREAGADGFIVNCWGVGFRLIDGPCLAEAA